MFDALEDVDLSASPLPTAAVKLSALLFGGLRNLRRLDCSGAEGRKWLFDALRRGNMHLQ
eukprot:gene17976-1065_t